MKRETKCNHMSGDFVNGYWLCAKCFDKLKERPRKYYMSVVEDGDMPPRQEVILAGIAECDGVTLSEFVSMMARRLVSKSRGSFTMYDATDYAVDILKSLGEPFGCDDMAWDCGGAWDLVDEDMQYWDGDGSGSNA